MLVTRLAVTTLNRYRMESRSSGIERLFATVVGTACIGEKVKAPESHTPGLSRR
jgi:hypothetical protein